ncbi:hypothetical protein ACQJBY_004158 [Aegilops geniculata]
MAAPSLRPEAEEDSKGAEVCLFDHSQEGFSRAVRAISELATGDPQPGFPDAEVERLASSVTFLREWRHFSYEPKGVSFVYGAGSASSGDDTPEITLPQFSSASFPQVSNTKTDCWSHTWKMGGIRIQTVLISFCSLGEVFGRWTGAQSCATSLVLV